MARLTALHDLPKPFTAEQQAEQKRKADRMTKILLAYWKVHGAPETLVERASQATALYKELYPGKRSTEP